MTSRETYEWILKVSRHARECSVNLCNGDFKTHSENIVEMVKMGFTREEMNCFFEHLYKYYQDKEESI